MGRLICVGSGVNRVGAFRRALLLVCLAAAPAMGQAGATPEADDAGGAAAPSAETAERIGATEAILNRAGDEGPPAARERAAEARERLRPLLHDPAQSDLDVWRLAGKIALATADDDLAAFAFEAIARLEPTYRDDDRLRAVMADLEARPIQERAAAIPAERAEFDGWYRDAQLADGGGAEAMFDVGAAYIEGFGVVRDEAEGAGWFRKSAELGSAAAMLSLGWCYDNGVGVTRDAAEAVGWYRKAAELGDAAAMFNLGVSYANGEGVAQDAVEAVRWYRKAADLGNADAMVNLGWCYDTGDGVARDVVAAAGWYRKAADLGDAVAMFNFGVSYDNGEGVAQDAVEAARWYRKAAELGNPDAMYNLAVSYANGEGVAPSDAEAVRWWRRAARLGDPDAQEVLRYRGIDW